MILDLTELTPPQVYANMIQILMPRPIAWVLTENSGGNFNIAPFSFFNAVCSDPPMVMISIGKKPDGTAKDTKINVEERADFIIHLVDESILDPMNESSASMDYGVSELEALGLETVPFEGSRLPRLAAAKIAFCCRRHQIVQLGNGPQNIVFGEVSRIFIDDTIVGEDAKGRMKVLADKLRPVGRIGAGEYVGFGEILKRDRPA